MVFVFKNQSISVVYLCTASHISTSLAGRRDDSENIRPLNFLQTQNRWLIKHTFSLQLRAALYAGCDKSQSLETH